MQQQLNLRNMICDENERLSKIKSMKIEITDFYLLIICQKFEFFSDFATDFRLL